MKVAELQAIVQRCQDVVSGELKLLQQWLADGALQIGRRAQVQSAQIYVGQGMSSAATRVAAVLNQLGAPDLGGAPLADAPADHLHLVDVAEQRLQSMQGTRAAAMPSGIFSLSLNEVETNADSAADAAETLFQDAMGG